MKRFIVWTNHLYALGVWRFNKLTMEEPERLCTYNGTDPSEELVVRIVDALIALERARAEIEDQALVREGEHHLHQVLGMPMVLEQHLFTALDIATRLHDGVWYDATYIKGRKRQPFHPPAWSRDEG